MKKLVALAIVVLAVVAFSHPALAVERDFRVFMTDGSWVRTAGDPVVADGKVKVRLPAGQLVVLPESQVDLERTDSWNSQAAEAHITTALPLPWSILYRPVTVAATLQAPADADPRDPSTAGDPGDRLRARIQLLKDQERALHAEKLELQEKAGQTEDPQALAELQKRIAALDSKMLGLRSERNGLGMQLQGWTRE